MNEPKANLWAPRHWPSWLGVALIYVIGRLPVPVLAVLGEAVGLLLYALHAPRRRIAQRNIALCFPDLGRTAQRRLARAHFRALGRSLFDTGVFWWASRRRMRRLVHLVGAEHLQVARATGRPVILLVPHFVAVQAGVALVLEHPIANFYKPVNNPVLRHLYATRMLRFGGRLIARADGIRAALRALRSGCPLYYLPDQDLGRAHSAFVPFFGVPAATTTALARLAGAADAIVLPCLARQRPLGGYEIIFRPPLEHYPSGNEEADARRMNHEIEQAVALMPAQYFWVHKRFKTRPDPAEPDLYR